MTDLDLTGRTALVSGAAQGLGEGMAKALVNGVRDAMGEVGKLVGSGRTEGRKKF